MIRQVFNALKEESRKGDFVHQVEKDLEELKITMTDDEIHQCSKGKWKHIVKKHVKEAAFSYLVKENATKDKTKQIKFNQLEMSNYLRYNKSLVLSKIIFAVRSGTLELKVWNLWKYDNDICVGCKSWPETMSHFMRCSNYPSETEEKNWDQILLFENDVRKQYEVAQKIRKRLEMRDIINNEDGLASLDILAPALQAPL
jgi:hypothetical protein